MSKYVTNTDKTTTNKDCIHRHHGLFAVVCPYINSQCCTYMLSLLKLLLNRLGLFLAKLHRYDFQIRCLWMQPIANYKQYHRHISINKTGRQSTITPWGGRRWRPQHSQNEMNKMRHNCGGSDVLSHSTKHSIIRFRPTADVDVE